MTDENSIFEFLRRVSLHEVAGEKHQFEEKVSGFVEFVLAPDDLSQPTRSYEMLERIVKLDKKIRDPSKIFEIQTKSGGILKTRNVNSGVANECLR